MKRLKAEGGEFAVTNLQPHIKKVFEITKLLPSQKIFANAAEADRYFDTIQRREKSRRLLPETPFSRPHGRRRLS